MLYSSHMTNKNDQNWEINEKDIDGVLNYLRTNVNMIYKNIKPLALVGILIFIAYMMTFRFAEEPKGPDYSREVFAHEIRTALELYKVETDHYPEELDDLVPEYIRKMILDSKTKERFYTYKKTSSQEYELCVQYVERQEECYYEP